jgi:hypothetical protein
VSYVSVSSTPEPSALGMLAYRKAVLPAHRLTEQDPDGVPFRFGAMDVVGDVLDLMRGKCSLVRVGYSPEKHRGIYARRDTCGSWECPFCIESRLERLAGPYVLWLNNGEAAVRAEFANELDWQNARNRKYKIKARETPGIVNLPVAGDERRVVWAPIGVIEGVTHRGLDLDSVFRADVRAVPLPPSSRQRSQHQILCTGCDRADLHVPVRASREITINGERVNKLAAACRTVGLDPLTLHRGQGFGKVAATTEQFEELRVALRG